MNIEAILSSDAHWNVNKKLAKQIGIVPTILLMELVFCRKKYGEPEFFESSKKLENALGIGAIARRSALEILIKNNFITVKKKGTPARYWFSILDENVFLALTSGVDTDSTSGVDTDSTSGVDTDSTIIKNINKNINKNIYNEEKKNNYPIIGTLNSPPNNVPLMAGNVNLEKTSPETTLECPKNMPRIDVDAFCTADPSQGSQARSIPSQKGLKSKIAKSVIAAFYEEYKKLNIKYKHKMSWDAIETKILKAQLEEAGISITELIAPLDFGNQTESNPYWKVILPVWRLVKSRETNKNSNFFKKKFLPSTFTVKYTDCLAEITLSAEDFSDDSSKLEALNNKLGGVV